MGISEKPFKISEGSANRTSEVILGGSFRTIFEILERIHRGIPKRNPGDIFGENPRKKIHVRVLRKIVEGLPFCGVVFNPSERF